MSSTPGPWVQFADGNDTVAIMPAMREGDICLFAAPYPKREDARLMAAAPDLLREAKRIVSILRHPKRSVSVLDCERLEAAIAKAEELPSTVGDKP